MGVHDAMDSLQHDALSEIHIMESNHFIMVALRNRADHYIFALWFLLLLLLPFFPRLISAVADRMSAILPDMVWPE